MDASKTIFGCLLKCLIVASWISLCQTNQNNSLKYSLGNSPYNIFGDLDQIDRSQDTVDLHNFGGVDLDAEVQVLQRKFQSQMVDELGIRIMQV